MLIRLDVGGKKDKYYGKKEGAREKKIKEGRKEKKGERGRKSKKNSLCNILSIRGNGAHMHTPTVLRNST